MALIVGVQYSGIPAGTILPCGNGTTLPRTVLCDGGQYLKTDPLYAALFAAIGITFGETNGSGGVGTTHFRVPDTRGIFLRGAGTQTFNSITYSGVIGTKQNDTFAAHTHSGTTDSTSRTQNWNTFSGTSPSDDAGNGQFEVNGISSINFSHTHTFTTTSAGSGTETRPANLGINYCIAY